MRYNGCNVYKFQSEAPVENMKNGFYHLWSVWEKGYEWWEIQWYGYNIINLGEKLVKSIATKDKAVQWEYAGIVQIYNNRIRKVQ